MSGEDCFRRFLGAGGVASGAAGGRQDVGAERQPVARCPLRVRPRQTGPGARNGATSHSSGRGRCYTGAGGAGRIDDADRPSAHLPDATSTNI